MMIKIWIITRLTFHMHLLQTALKKNWFIIQSIDKPVFNHYCNSLIITYLVYSNNIIVIDWVIVIKTVQLLRLCYHCIIVTD